MERLLYSRGGEGGETDAQAAVAGVERVWSLKRKEHVAMSEANFNAFPS